MTVGVSGPEPIVARSPPPWVAEGPTLLLVDEDAQLRRTLQREMEQRSFRVVVAGGFREALELAQRIRPELAVLDLKLGDGNGIDLVRRLIELHPDLRIVILTSYGNITTAVTAVKAGAVDYLSKPADAEEVMTALLASGPHAPPPRQNPMRIDRVRWEHIHRVFELSDRNVTHTARRLGMGRRSLQRILGKHAPHE